MPALIPGRAIQLLCQKSTGRVQLIMGVSASNLQVNLQSSCLMVSVMTNMAYFGYAKVRVLPTPNRARAYQMSSIVLVRTAVCADEVLNWFLPRAHFPLSGTAVTQSRCLPKCKYTPMI